ncbi:uncharacterized protein V6R79_013756 [Siganus canaliculatus]
MHESARADPPLSALTRRASFCILSCIRRERGRFVKLEKARESSPFSFIEKDIIQMSVIFRSRYEIQSNNRGQGLC